MTTATQWIPDVQRGPFDFVEFDGELSTSVNFPMEWTTFNRERGQEGVSDGANKSPPTITISGVVTAIPTRLENPLTFNPPPGPNRLEDFAQKLAAIQDRRETGTLVVPHFGVFTSVVIGTISGTRNRPNLRAEWTVPFQKINVVDLLVVPAVVDQDAQALGANGIQDQGPVTG